MPGRLVGLRGPRTARYQLRQKGLGGGGDHKIGKPYRIGQPSRYRPGRGSAARHGRQSTVQRGRTAMAGTYTGYGEWPTWLDSATQTPACRGLDTNLFFPTLTTTGLKAHQQVAQARAVCAACPLLNPCRDWAITQPAKHLDGIWGGTTAHERKLLQAKQGRAVVDRPASRLGRGGAPTSLDGGCQAPAWARPERHWD